MRLGLFERVVQIVYPPRCILCGDAVQSDFGLCGPCWRDTPFITGLVCDACGAPLMGEDNSEVHLCDDCIANSRPWSRGRSALLYRDQARKMVLGLKYGDRHDVVRPAGLWMARAAKPLLTSDMLIAPIPLHWTRILKRRFNQSALLAQEVARQTGLACCPDLLVRHKRTRPLKGMDAFARNLMLSNAISVNASRHNLIIGRPILLVDDVMTTGATFSVAARACFSAGAKDVCILTLARSAKDP